MRHIIRGSVLILSILCILIVLMCTFTESSDAAMKAKGKTTKKEQTVKVTLKKGVAVIKFVNPNGWAFSQLQKTGDNRKGSPVGGVCAKTEKGKVTTFVVPVAASGDYYVYFNGSEKETNYRISYLKAGGTLKSGRARKSSSYLNDTSVVYYKINVPGRGILDVSVKDASYLYPGYSKVRLKKNGALISEEEYLLEGLGFKTTYGVSKGAYKIGVRSSSELYKIKATFKAIDAFKGAGKKANSWKVKKDKKAMSVIGPGNDNARWYRVILPKKSKNNKRKAIRIAAKNSNVDIYGGIRFTILFSKKKNGKNVVKKKTYLLNNDSEELRIPTVKGEKRTVYIKVEGYKGASGVYSIYHD